MLTISRLEERFKDKHAKPQQIKAVRNERVVGISAWIIALCGGDVHIALFIAQIIYLATISQQKGREWFYKEAKEWKEEFGLSRWQLEKARRFCIKAGFLEEKKKRLQHKNACVMHYKVNLRVIERLLELITLVKEEDGTLQALLNRETEKEERKQRREQHKVNRTKLVSRASPQMKYREKTRELEQEVRKEGFKPIGQVVQQSPPSEDYKRKLASLSIEEMRERGRRFAKLLEEGKTMKEATAIMKRIEELRAGGMKYQEAYERAVFEQEQLSLI